MPRPEFWRKRLAHQDLTPGHPTLSAHRVRSRSGQDSGSCGGTKVNPKSETGKTARPGDFGPTAGGDAGEPLTGKAGTCSGGPACAPYWGGKSFLQGELPNPRPRVSIWHPLRTGCVFHSSPSNSQRNGAWVLPFWCHEGTPLVHPPERRHARTPHAAGVAGGRSCTFWCSGPQIWLWHPALPPPPAPHPRRLLGRVAGHLPHPLQETARR